MSKKPLRLYVSDNYVCDLEYFKVNKFRFTLEIGAANGKQLRDIIALHFEEAKAKMNANPFYRGVERLTAYLPYRITRGNRLLFSANADVTGQDQPKLFLKWYLPKPEIVNCRCAPQFKIEEGAGKTGKILADISFDLETFDPLNPREGVKIVYSFAEGENGKTTKQGYAYMGEIPLGGNVRDALKPSLDFTVPKGTPIGGQVGDPPIGKVLGRTPEGLVIVKLDNGVSVFAKESGIPEFNDEVKRHDGEFIGYAYKSEVKGTDGNLYGKEKFARVIRQGVGDYKFEPLKPEDDYVWVDVAFDFYPKDSFFGSGKFVDNANKLYSYRCANKKVEVGNIVIVDSPQSGFTPVLVVNVRPQNAVKPTERSKWANKEIFSPCDFLFGAHKATLHLAKKAAHELNEKREKERKVSETKTRYDTAIREVNAATQELRSKRDNLAKALAEWDAAVNARDAK